MREWYLKAVVSVSINSNKMTVALLKFDLLVEFKKKLLTNHSIKATKP